MQQEHHSLLGPVKNTKPLALILQVVCNLVEELTI